MTDYSILDKLTEVIKMKKDANPDSSYTASLFAKGLNKVAQKFGEEAVEVTIAALAESDQRLKSELADLFYHLFILLEAKDISIEDVLAELKSRDHVVLDKDVK